MSADSNIFNENVSYCLKMHHNQLYTIAYKSAAMLPSAHIIFHGDVSSGLSKA